MQNSLTFLQKAQNAYERNTFLIDNGYSHFQPVTHNFDDEECVEDVQVDSRTGCLFFFVFVLVFVLIAMTILRKLGWI